VAHWQVRDARARFSELLDVTVKEGPQVVTRHGIETAVLVSVHEWRRLRESSRTSLKELLLSASPRFENLIPERRSFRRRHFQQPPRS
jgi:antitoxin Phd